MDCYWGGTTHKLAYSYDGETWYVVPSSTSIITRGEAVASNSRIGPVVVDSQITLNEYGISGTNKLDIIADNYFNTGFTNMSVNINSNNL